MTMTKFETFLMVLEKSVEKNGPEHPVTLGHLKNIANLADKIHKDKIDSRERRLNQIIDDFWTDTMRDGVHQ